MLSDVSRVTTSLREGTFAAIVARLREVIMKQLRETGSYTVREGGRTFTITVQRPEVEGPQSGEQVKAK
jgi:hypothetical protein